MKQQMGWILYSDETMNLFKLKLYKWNVNDAKKYYKNDNFCLDYCIRSSDGKYGCLRKKCPYQHSINFRDLFNVERDYNKMKCLSLYLMYKKVYNDKNSVLFCWYAIALMQTSKLQQDYSKCEKYFLKSLSIDNDCDDPHNGYAQLLTSKLHDYHKAEYHFNRSLTITPNNARNHANFALFLIDKRQKYDEALSHCEKACEVEPNNSYAHCMKAYTLLQLNRFHESLTEYEMCLKLNQNDAILSSQEIKYVQKQIDLLTNKVGNQNIPQAKQNHEAREATPQKPDSNAYDEKEMLVTDEGTLQFGQMSIMDQIDEILAQMIQIEEIVDENNNGNDHMNKRKIKAHLLDVQNKLGKVRTKCNKSDTFLQDVQMRQPSGYNYRDLKSQLEKLRTEIANGSTKSSLSLLVELKQLEQDAKVQHQKIEV